MISIFNKITRALRFRLTHGPLARWGESLLYYWDGMRARTASHHSFMVAGGVAYAAAICAIPLTLIIFAIVGRLLAADEMSGRVNALLTMVAPLETYAPDAREFVLSRVEEMKRFRGTAALAGALILAFTASGLFSALRTALNAIFPSARVGWVFKGKLTDFLMILILVVLVSIAAVTWPIVSILLESARSIPGLERSVGQAFGDALGIVVSAGVSLSLSIIVYAIIPSARPDWRTIALSAGIATIMWELAKSIFRWYLGAYAGFDRVYGIFALGVVFVIWVYYSALILLLSAEFGQLWRERRHGATSSVL